MLIGLDSNVNAHYHANRIVTKDHKANHYNFRYSAPRILTVSVHIH
jgi:hypothetical protein